MQVRFSLIGLKIYKEPKLNEPVMIAALPDMGNVAGMATDYLVKKFKTELFAEFFSYWPPFVSHKEGYAEFSQQTYRFYASEESNFVIFSGDYNPVEPRLLFELCYEVVNMAKRLKVKRLYAMGAAHREDVLPDPRVFAAVNNRSILSDLDKMGVRMLEGEGHITGFNGVILGIAKENNIDAVCLLGEIDNPRIIQPKTVINVLKILTDIVGLQPLDMSELEEQEKRKALIEKQFEHELNRPTDTRGPGIG